MKQYKYDWISNPTLLKSELLNNLGKNGWELITVTYDGAEWQFFFKREINTHESSSK